MKIFNEEATRKSNTTSAVILIESLKEGQIIMEALNHYKKCFPRRKASHKIIDQVESQLAVY